MAYVRKAKKATAKAEPVVVPNIVDMIKGQLSEVEQVYLAKLDAAWSKIGGDFMWLPSDRHRLNAWISLGSSNRTQFPDLVDALTGLINSSEGEVLKQAERLLATHGVTQIHTTLIQ